MYNLREAYKEIYQSQLNEAHYNPATGKIQAEKPTREEIAKLAKAAAESGPKKRKPVGSVRKNSSTFKPSSREKAQADMKSWASYFGSSKNEETNSYLEPDMEKRRKNNEKAIEDMKKTKAHKDMVASVRKKFDEAVYGGEKPKPVKPVDKRMVVTAADKKANTKAYQLFKAGNSAYRAADHLQGESVYDDLYNFIIESLIEGGFVQDYESAEQVIENMSDAWLETIEEEWKTVSKKAIDKLGGVANSGDMLNQARYTHKKGEKPPGSTTLRKRLEAQTKEAGLPPHRGQKGGMKREYSAATADAMLGNKGGPAAAAIKAGDQKDAPHVQYYLNYMRKGKNEDYNIGEATKMRKELGKEGEIGTRKELAKRSNAYQRSGSVDKTIAAAERGADRPYVANIRGESDADRAARQRAKSKTLEGLAIARRGSVRDKPRAGLRGYAANIQGSDRDLQSARSSAMAAGTLTPREKKQLN
jgi:hypothetical protein